MSTANSEIVVGLSGGVDSALSASLLVASGARVRAMFMQNWDEQDQYCSAREDYRDACAVAQRLGIKIDKVDLSRAYWDNVFQHFLDELSNGRTPNPDILCNREIKFKAFLQHALDTGAEQIATGHYARVSTQSGTASLLRGVDSNKDQSYFLHAVHRDALARSVFPLGAMEKSTVREAAKSANLHVHNKSDSTGICFIGERNFREFLSQYLPAQPGPIIDDSGRLLGRHNGLMYYTLGQRKGLGIGGVKGAAMQPWFVLQKRLNDNTLIISQQQDHPQLWAVALSADKLHWIADLANTGKLDNLVAKTRYREPDRPCSIAWTGETLDVQFNAPVRAVTPGQSVVLYRDDLCLGGAVINEVKYRDG